MVSTEGKRGEKAEVCQMTQELSSKLVATGAVMNPPKSLDITEAVWDHLDREHNKMQPTSDEDPWNVSQEAWRATE